LALLIDFKIVLRPKVFSFSKMELKLKSYSELLSIISWSKVIFKTESFFKSSFLSFYDVDMPIATNINKITKKEITVTSIDLKILFRNLSIA